MSGSTVLEDYRERLGAAAQHGVDELLDGARSDTAARVRSQVERLDVRELRRRAGVVREFVEDDGITYGRSGGSMRAGTWALDPLPVVLDGSCWSELSAGLAQRAQLLDLVLSDVYGDQRLLHDGVVPAQVVLAHPEFVPEAVGTMDRLDHRLLLPSVDLARGRDGRWTVVGDRTQAPSGAGYALADRRLVARTFPGLYRGVTLDRLRVHFDQVQTALADLRDAGEDDGRVVLLSPGPASETAFDQDLTASLLGIPVVQAEDLVAHDGRVWLRGAPEEPVAVILRRVDSTWMDPLELRSDSQLGVPGLLEVVRSGAVTVVNPVGSGVLENPGLSAYLPAACRALLGEDLLLPTPHTWWCGASESAKDALERLDSLVIKPLDGAGGRARFGWLLSSQEREELRARIDAEPWAWTLQEPVAMSTAPVVTRDGLEPRRFTLRTYGVAVRGGYHFMPGGLGRVSPSVLSRTTASGPDAPAKDVWVEAVDPARTARALPSAHLTSHGALTVRAADDLYWLGRYAERAESAVRLLLVVDDLLGEHLEGPDSPGRAVMQAMSQAASDVTGRPVGEEPDLHALVFDDQVPGTVAFAIAHLVQDAQSVRHLLSPDLWLVLSRLERALAAHEGVDLPLRPGLTEMLESLLALGGLLAEDMVRDAAWSFLEGGRRIERALQTIALLRRTMCEERSPVIDGQVTEAVLRVTGSLHSHQRRLVFGRGPAAPVGSALDLLLVDEQNPRSVAFQLVRADAAIQEMPPPRVDLGSMRTALGHADPEMMSASGREGLRGLLRELEAGLREASERLEHSHFARPVTHRRLPGLTGPGAR